MKSLPRRSFLKTLGAAGLAAPFISRSLLAAQPSKILRHASFGASGMAWSDIQAIASNPFVKLVAVADVDLNKVADVKAMFPDVRVYQDWRQLLDKEQGNIDSCNVSVPDHMHAPIAYSAMQLGKHVYCQKPLAHDIYETRVLTEFAREKKLITQMGIQIHSQKVYRQAVAIVHSGAIGKVKEVHTWSNKKWGDVGAPPTATAPVPGPNNLMLAIGQSLTLRGFIVSRHEDLRADFMRDMSAWVTSGQVKYRETRYEGLAQAPQAFIGLFSGANTGKMIVHLAD